MMGVIIPAAPPRVITQTKIAVALTPPNNHPS